MMQGDPDLWNDVLNWCADITAKFIRSQVLAGASALQVFDSWAGRLSEAEYVEFAAPASRRLFDQLKDLRYGEHEVPRVHFGLGTKDLLPHMLEVGATALGVDYHSDLSEVSAQFENQLVLQGNIDPQLLDQDFEVLEKHILEVLAKGSKAKGHVVNLGHGVPPTTNPEVLTKIVELVHRASAN
jgi:uroporphyrinogen decarboxylase